MSHETRNDEVLDAQLVKTPCKVGLNERVGVRLAGASLNPDTFRSVFSSFISGSLKIAASNAKYHHTSNRYLAYASEGSAAALAHTKGEVYNDNTLQQTWRGLPPLDRAILQMIARGVTDVFSAAVRGQLGKGLGEAAPSIGIVQKAVGRLTRGEILVRVERGEYRVQDDVFLEWLKGAT